MTLLDLLHLMRKHLKVVIALPIVCAVAMGIFSFAVMPNSYTSDTTFYVLSSRATRTTPTPPCRTSTPAR